MQSVKVGGTELDLKVSTLPPVARDLTDRNRTSPFAFTGNKFEFRAVGAKQSPSFPVCLLNTAMAASLIKLNNDLIAQKGSKPVPSTEDILTVVRKWIARSKAIRFEGNNYSQEWVVEAEKRGLPNIRSAPDAFAQLLEEKHAQLLVSQGILTPSEVKSRYHILCEKYTKDIVIEANVLKNMVMQGVLPAVFSFRKELATSVKALKDIGEDATPEVKALKTLVGLTTSLQDLSAALSATIDQVDAEEDHAKQAQMASKVLMPLLDKVREAADAIEAHVDDKKWPFPKYSELLF